jgi:hypothetical protein
MARPRKDNNIPTSPLNIRIPTDSKCKLEQLAADHHRSLTAEILYLIEQAFAQQDARR